MVIQGNHYNINISNEEAEAVYKRLKESYKNGEAVVSKEDKMKLAEDLVEINQDARNTIIEISSLLNMAKDDSFYIPYALLTAYRKMQVDWEHNPNDNIPFIKKDEGLKHTYSVIKNNFKNKPFINSVYKLIRTGDKPEVIFYKQQLQKLMDEANKEQEKQDIFNLLEKGLKIE
ncbi:MAG: hypothetical protein K6F04_01660 [bacterium]|nr:hypothetical protein [bacterium]